MTSSKWPELQFSYDPGDRPELIDAVNKTLAAYKLGEPAIGHCLPPRSGKSTIIRAAAIELKAAGAPFVHVLTPWKNLSVQLHHKGSVENQLETCPSDGPRPYRGNPISRISNFSYWKTTKETTIVSSTLHLVHVNKMIVRAAIEMCVERGAKAPVFLIDEAHLVGENGEWWDTIEEFIVAGAFVVTLTGTPRRVDGKAIPGFKPEPIEKPREVKKLITVRKSDAYLNAADELVRLTTRKEKVFNEATVCYKATGETVEYKEAFDRGWLQPCAPHPIDFDVLNPETGHIVSLSSLTPSQTQPHLGRWLRSAECCRAAAKVSVRELNTWRRDYPDTKMLVITTFDSPLSCGDTDGPAEESAAASNAHAREIRRALMDAICDLQAELGNSCVLRPEDLSIEICTSKHDNGETDQNSAKKLRSFGLTTTDKEGNHPIDILIVKNMGVVGLDVPECKVLCDLSQVRLGPVKLQLAFRPLTRWQVGGELVTKSASLIYPQDRNNQDFYANLSEQSKLSRVSMLVDEGKDDDVETKVQPPDPDLELVKGSGTVKEVGSETGQWVSIDSYDVVAYIRDTYAVARSAKVADIIDSMKAGAFGSLEELQAKASAKKKAEPKPSAVENIAGPDADNEPESINDVTTTIADTCAPAGSPLWVRIKSALTNEAKRYCGVSPSISWQDIHDPEVRRCVVDAVPAIRDRVLYEVVGRG